MSNRRWLLWIAAATLYAWLTGLGSVRCHAQWADQVPEECAPGSDCWRAQQQQQGRYQPQVVPVQFPPQTMPPSQDVYAATVRVGSGDSRGSGTLIDSDGDTALVLTARHVLGNGECWVRFRDGQASRALDVPLVDRDQADLCVLIIKAPSGIKPIELASNDPPANEVVTTLGYGSENKLGWFNCRYLRSFVNASNNSSLYELTGMARRGDSGGPVVNSAGHQFGVIMAVDQYERPTLVNGPCARPLLSFVSRVRERWREWIAKNRARKDAKPIGPLLPVPPREQDKSPEINPAEKQAAPSKPADKSPLDAVGDAVESFTVSKATAAIMLALGLTPTGAVGWAAAAGLGFVVRRMYKRGRAKIEAKVEGVIKDRGDTLHPFEPAPAVDEDRLASRVLEKLTGPLSAIVSRIDKFRDAATVSNVEPVSTAAPQATEPTASTVVPDLEAEIARLREQLKATKQPVIYASPAIGDNLPRMRAAMKQVSDYYPAGRGWVKQFERAYELLLSGEKN